MKHIQSDHERKNRCEVVWGDISDELVVRRISKGVDAVIHLAAVIPPLSENNEELSYRVNVVATQHLIKAVKEGSPKARFIFASSVGVYGYQDKSSPPKTAADPVHPVNAYGRQKVMCEELIRSSGLEWAILRLGVCFDSKFALQANLATIRMQFDVHPGVRIEQVHPKDVALALSNAVSASGAKSKILLIGGGEQCRTTSGKLIQSIFDVVGIKLPDRIYGNENFYTEWIDTSESQRILNYQKHTLSGTVMELQRKLRIVNILIFPLRSIAPIVFEKILRHG
jgi:nucleoside-diphosphate-sugar epimerase